MCGVIAPPPPPHSRPHSYRFVCRIYGVFPFRLSCKFQVKLYEKVLRRNGNRVNKGRWQLITWQLQLNKWIYMDVFVLNIIFSCRKMVKIRVDLMIKLQQFPLLPYRWSKNPLRRNGNNYLTWNSQLRRNGNKPYIHVYEWNVVEWDFKQANNINKTNTKTKGLKDSSRTSCVSILHTSTTKLGDNTFVIEWFAGINCIILWSQI